MTTKKYSLLEPAERPYQADLSMAEIDALIKHHVKMYKQIERKMGPALLDRRISRSEREANYRAARHHMDPEQKDCSPSSAISNQPSAIITMTDLTHLQRCHAAYTEAADLLYDAVVQTYTLGFDVAWDGLGGVRRRANIVGHQRPHHLLIYQDDVRSDISIIDPTAVALTLLTPR
jgi:hypothetical protein